MRIGWYDIIIRKTPQLPLTDGRETCRIREERVFFCGHMASGDNEIASIIEGSDFACLLCSDSATAVV